MTNNLHLFIFLWAILPLGKLLSLYSSVEGKKLFQIKLDLLRFGHFLCYGTNSVPANHRK